MRRTVLTAAGWSAFIFAIYVFLGFRPAPPQTIAEGETCFKCRRTIVEHKLAAEIMDRNLPTKYRSPGCMAAYAAQHPSKDSRYYVTDFVSGGLIEAERAFDLAERYFGDLVPGPVPDQLNNSFKSSAKA